MDILDTILNGNDMVLTTFFVVSGLLLLVYTIQAGAVVVGQYKRPSDAGPATAPDAPPPFVSILIAVRNEEKNLALLLDSLLAQDYPTEHHEVIIVNDHSEDRTAGILNDYATRFRNLTVLESPDKPGDLTGKENAIEEGKKVARGELFLFTDGDCTLHPSWISSYVAEFQRGNGFIFSRTDIRADTISSLIQKVDLDIMFAVAGGLAKIGKPASCMGTNFAVSRALDEILGSYRDRGASAVEDYIILTAARIKQIPIKYIDSVPPLVTTLPQPSFVAFMSQGLRWISGGNVFKSRLLLAWVLPIALLHYVLLVSLVAGILVSPAYLLPIVCTLIVDLFLHLAIVTKFRSWSSLLVFPLFEIFFILRSIAYPPLVPFLEKRLTWKGRRLDFLDTPAS
jgi:cellulose synthase/poly-beta-1,6-N-acetylglucosamine synthase-like glycosyltransferase